MKYIKLFENYQNNNLMIIDVQKSFKEFFTDKYVDAVKSYAKSFSKVYQIWDNHIDGKDVDLDYLYDSEPDIPMHSDLYRFPNEVEIIEKRYNYDVNIDFFKEIIEESEYERVSEMETNKTIKTGTVVETTKGTILVYIGNNHIWYHCPKKLYEILMDIKKTQETASGTDLIIIGGSDSECLEDVMVCGESLGVKMKRNPNYIYSATNCPI